MSDRINQIQQRLLIDTINRKAELLNIAVANSLNLYHAGKLSDLEPDDRKEALALLDHFKKRMKKRLP